MSDVNLSDYLPQFLREYKELRAVTDAEEPEFDRLRRAVSSVLNNEFIETADEDGMARFEKLLRIVPASSDTLESRRARVQSRWFTELPYTLRMFIQKLNAMSQGAEVCVTPDYPHYRVDIRTAFELFGQVDELERLIELMFPCSIIADARNDIACSSGYMQYTGGVANVAMLICASEI